MNWLLNLWYSWFPPALPSFSKMERKVDNSSARDWKTSAIVWAKCGLFVCTYSNSSRRDAAIDLVNPSTGESRNLIRNSFETFGRPVLHGGWWYFPCEGHSPRIVRIRDSDGRVDSGGRVQPDDYSACGTEDFFAVCKRGGGKPFLWSFISGRSGHKYRTLDGIPSGIVRSGADVVISVSDGAVSGVESTNGQVVLGACPTIAEVNRKLIALFKDGEVRDLTGVRRGSILAQTRRKPCRSVVSGGLAYWVTSNPDALYVTNGKAIRHLWDAPGPDISTGTKDGNLFDTDVAVDGDRVAVARSQANGGFEVWIGKVG